MKQRSALFACLMSILMVLVSAPVVMADQELPGEAAPEAAPASVTGRLNIYFGDAQPGQPEPPTIYEVELPSGKTVRLDIGEKLPRPLDELMALRGQAVRATGRWQNGNPNSAVLSVSALGAEDSAFTTQAETTLAAVTGAKPWVSVLCKFSDIASEPKSQAYFNGMYASTYPGLDHYWREVSFNLMNVSGSTATQWFTLPKPRSSYVRDMNGDGVIDFDHNLATTDCTGVANPTVNFSLYVGINMMFNSDLDGYAWGGTRYLTLDGVSRVWYTTWEPPWGYADITVIAHEMGHGIGFPHSSGRYGQTYDNPWDVMSDTWTNCSLSRSLTYGCLGQHTIAYHKNKAGWISAERRRVVPTNSIATVTVDPLESTSGTGYLIVEVPVGASTTRYYTVETRRKTGYDVKLPAEAVIIHEVDTTRTRPAQVIDADGNGNNADGGAQWLPGETFTDATNNISIKVEASAGSGFTVTINNAVTSAPDPFTKLAPTEGSSVPPVAPLEWNSAKGAAQYYYCLDRDTNNTCDSSWVPAGNVTSTTAGLESNTTYRWQVKASNSVGETLADGGTWKTFTTGGDLPDLVVTNISTNSPGAFVYGEPFSATVTIQNTGQGAAGAFDVALYLDRDADNTCGSTGDTGLQSVGGLPAGESTTVTFNALVLHNAGPNTIAARADAKCVVNEVNESNAYAITVAPLAGYFDKISPTSGSTLTSTLPTLRWEESEGADSYEVCVVKDTESCTYYPVGKKTSTTPPITLLPNTKYKWQVRAVTTAGTNAANTGAALWTFTTGAWKGVFLPTVQR